MGTRSKLFKVTFLAPRGGEVMEVEIGPQTTGQIALDGLVAAQFVTPPGADQTYALQLQRTGASLQLAESLAASGVKDGDQIAVVSVQAGAGRFTWRA